MSSHAPSNQIMETLAPTSSPVLLDYDSQHSLQEALYSDVEMDHPHEKNDDEDLDQSADRAAANAESHFRDEDEDEEAATLKLPAHSNKGQSSGVSLILRAIRQSSLSFCLVLLGLIVISAWLGSSLDNNSDENSPAMASSTPTASSSYSSSDPPSYLIEQAMGRSEIFSSLVEDLQESKYMQLAAKHPAMTNVMSSSSHPHGDWQTFHMPDISIVGLPHVFDDNMLYNLLVSHPNVAPFHAKSAEFCFNLGPEDVDVILKSVVDDEEEQLQDDEIIQQVFFHANHVATSNKEQSSERQWGHVDHNRDANDGILTVNACMDPRLVLMQRQYLHQRPKIQAHQKYIVVFRDPAQWMWNTYLDGTTIEPQAFLHGDQSEGSNESTPIYRSPVHFHELMRSGGRLRDAHELMTQLRDESGLRDLELLLNSGIPSENILALKLEDLGTTVDTMATLSDFLGLDKDGFDTELLSLQNDDIGGNNPDQPMLEETRDLVYLQMLEECQLWAETFDVAYEDCLTTRAKYLG